MRDNPPTVTNRRMSVALVMGGVLAGLAMAPVLALFGAATLIMSIPVVVGLAVFGVAVRTPALENPVVVAVLAAGMTAVVLYVTLLGLALSAVPEDFQEAM